jgi:FKBP-type peptidyl-prolyl cis-trans isomerase
MNKTVSIVLFAVVAVAVIWGGIWYSQQMSQDDQQTQVAAGSQAIAQQQTIMNNLKTTDDIVGTGAEAQNGDTVSVLYSGSLDNGTVFDASSLHGNQPFSFVLGAGQVIKGWDLGVLGMKVGGKRELTIPSELGYGAQGAGSTIPPNATLHFTVQLLSVTSTAANAAQ